MKVASPFETPHGKPSEEIGIEFLGEIEKRHGFTRKPEGALQIAKRQGKLTHLHCKVCDNSWKAKDGKPYVGQFDLLKRRDGTVLIKCKNCGQAYVGS